jgi:hypothetical protein
LICPLISQSPSSWNLVSKHRPEIGFRAADRIGLVEAMDVLQLDLDNYLVHGRCLAAASLASSHGPAPAQRFSACPARSILGRFEAVDLVESYFFSILTLRRGFELRNSELRDK